MLISPEFRISYNITGSTQYALGGTLLGSLVLVVNQLALFG